MLIRTEQNLFRRKLLQFLVYQHAYQIHSISEHKCVCLFFYLNKKKSIIDIHNLCALVETGGREMFQYGMKNKKNLIRFRMK